MNSPVISQELMSGTIVNVEICAADAGSFDFYEDVVVAYFRNWNSHDGMFPWFRVLQGFHGRWDLHCHCDVLLVRLCGELRLDLLELSHVCDLEA